MAHLPGRRTGPSAVASEFLPESHGLWDYSGTGGTTPTTSSTTRPPARGSRILERGSTTTTPARRTRPRWVEHGQGGHVEHYSSTGVTLGGLPDWDSVSRRVGYVYYIDFGAMGRGLHHLRGGRASLGAGELRPAGLIWGYFEDKEFVPEDWHVGYLNPASRDGGRRRRGWRGSLPHRRRRPVRRRRRGGPFDPGPERAGAHPPWATRQDPPVGTCSANRR